MSISESKKGQFDYQERLSYTRGKITILELVKHLEKPVGDPFFFVPNLGFLHGYSKDAITQEVGAILDPQVQEAQATLREFNKRSVRLASGRRLKDSHLVYYEMTGLRHGHLAWLGKLYEDSTAQDFGIAQYVEDNGIFGNESEEQILFFEGRNPSKPTDGMRTAQAIRQLYNSGVNSPLILVDCQDLVEVRFNSLVDFLEERSVGYTYEEPLPHFRLDNPNSIRKLAAYFSGISSIAERIPVRQIRTSPHSSFNTYRRFRGGFSSHFTSGPLPDIGTTAAQEDELPNQIIPDNQLKFDL